MRKNKYLKIGVLGGMGPEASATFYLRVIKLFQTELQARHNFEYPEMLIHNIPSPDNVEAGVDNELNTYLLNSVNLLEQAGMELLAIPCNSAHVHRDSVIDATTVSVMNILEETAKVVSKAGVDRVLLLGTKSTLGYGIYPPYLQRYNIETIIPEEHHQDEITRLIMTFCEGGANSTSREAMLNIIKKYPAAQGVVLGCTEIPFIVNQADMAIPCFDTLEILAKATFERCRID